MGNSAGRPVVLQVAVAAASAAIPARPVLAAAASVVIPAGQVLAAAVLANPIGAGVILGFAGFTLGLGLSILNTGKLVKDNSTMREIEARLERQEEECRRRVAEADHRAQVAQTSATEREVLSIRPVVLPTREQYSAAKQRVQYDPAKFHFAVCGTAGSGKSSLINAYRGLKRSDEGAAKVKVTECTREVTRYPDPSNELPNSRFVWYDIPGAGTPGVPEWRYFNDQGLFVFDFIIMVYDARFTTIDVSIIENCLHFDIPFFIVRSKSDQNIENMIKVETDSELGDSDYEECYQAMTEKYVKATRSDFNHHIQTMAQNPDIVSRDQQLLYGKRVYIVSESALRGLLPRKSSGRERRTRRPSRIIDDKLLIADMLKQAASRRF